MYNYNIIISTSTTLQEYGIGLYLVTGHSGRRLVKSNVEYVYAGLSGAHLFNLWIIFVLGLRVGRSLLPGEKIKTVV